MRVLLLSLLVSTAFAKETCITNNGFYEFDDLLKATAQNCNNNDLVVTALCRTSTPQGYATLWRVVNSGPACDSNANFSHNLQHDNLVTTWPSGPKYICGAFWNTGVPNANLTLNVTGNNAQMDNTTESCSNLHPANPLSLCGLTALPINLVSFTAASAGDSCVQVNFTTGVESNSKGIRVERSRDSRKFSDIAFISSTNPNGGSYSYKDCEPKFQSTYYYRLTQVDHDGKSETFKIVAVNLPIAEPKVFPVPAQNEVTVAFNTKSVNMVKVRLVDTGGKVVYKKDLEIQNNSDGFRLDVRTYPSGVYFLQVWDEKDTPIIEGSKGKIMVLR